MPPVNDFAIWALCALAIAGVLARPFGVPEWVWAFGAAFLVAVTGLFPLAGVAHAVRDGTDVYLFLAGMMLLAEIARCENVFTWCARIAVRASGGSRARLFTLVYGVGIVVTAVLSNDATAVVLTPAIAASVRAAKAEPLPYLFACALIANAASFIFPISNPANLVVFAHHVPPLGRWLAGFALPSICAVSLTYLTLRVVFRRELAGVSQAVEPIALGAGGRIALAGIGCTAAALVIASAMGAGLGAVTALAALSVYAVVLCVDGRAVRPAIRSVSWSTIALVAGLFVMVGAAEQTGLLGAVGRGLRAIAALPEPLALAAAGFTTAAGSNAINNLPAGLIAGKALANVQTGRTLQSAIAIGIDLGPNLSVTGSLATILWLSALRRERIVVSAWQFLRVGAVAMPIALIAAIESLLAVPR